MAICADCGQSFVNMMDTGEVRQSCPQCGSTARVISLRAQIHATASTPAISISDANMAINAAPPFAFGAIVTPLGKISDGDIIKLVDPVYTQLILEIQKNSQIVHRIDWRKWEEIIAAAYDKAGFDEVILTPRTGDNGRDIIAIKHGFGSVKFIEQVKAYGPDHKVRADEVRALLGVLHAERDASKAIFTTTSRFAPKIEEDKLIKPYLPTRLELISKEKLLERLYNTLQNDRLPR